MVRRRVGVFKLLVTTVLSQNTNWRNVEKAMRNLRPHEPVTPDAIIEIGVERLEDLIKPAGLHRVKAVKLVEAARFVRERLGGDLKSTLHLPLEDARAKLMEIPGVGQKTADVILAFAGGKPILPVDTHIDRISKRLGLTGKKAGYEEVKDRLEELVLPGERGAMHLALIEFGRRVCKAINPKCVECPILELCPSKVGLTSRSSAGLAELMVSEG